MCASARNRTRRASRWRIHARGAVASRIAACRCATPPTANGCRGRGRRRPAWNPKAPARPSRAGARADRGRCGYAGPTANRGACRRRASGRRAGAGCSCLARAFIRGSRPARLAGVVRRTGAERRRADGDEGGRRRERPCLRIRPASPMRSSDGTLGAGAPRRRPPDARRDSMPGARTPRGVSRKNPRRSRVQAKARGRRGGQSRSRPAVQAMCMYTSPRASSSSICARRLCRVGSRLARPIQPR